MERDDKPSRWPLGQIEKQFGKGSIMRLGEHGNVGVAAIPTGALALDIALGIGGLPRGRVVEVFGPEASGKSTLAMHVVAEAQRNGGVCAYIDAEHAMDPVYASAIGVNVDELLISQPDTGEQALEIADMLIRSGALDVVVIDSVAALVPRAEIEGEMGDTHVGLQARLMSQALRKLTAQPQPLPHDLHLHQPAAGEDRRDVRVARDHAGRPGAEVLLVGAARHPAGGVHQGRHRDHRQPRPGQGGRRTRSRRRSSMAEFDIMYGKGISREGSLLDVGIDLGIVKKSGAWFTYEGEQLGQGRENAKQFLTENLDLMFEISEKIKDAVGIEEVPVEPDAEADAEVKAADSSAGEPTNGNASGNGKAGGRSGNGKRAEDAETLEIET